MCNKNSPPPISETETETTNSIIMNMMNNKKKKHSSLKPHRRRNRTKTRKPKFLSLRLQLSQAQPENPTREPDSDKAPPLNLFPLQPEDREMHEENNVALLFSSDGGATLTGLLEDESTTTAEGSLSPSASAMTCPPALEGLVRKAMRGREVEGSEERWVCYSEVVEEKKEVTTEEVTSYCCGGTSTTTSFGSLSLKLDHEGILNAWSDKGPLYVGDEAPQTVPDLFNSGAFLHNALPPNVSWDGNAWKVPEDCGGNNKLKLGQREASVQRYKEKRQSRLFAKRIRYEVRKLNAEKRPRMKGRFVKRE